MELSPTLERALRDLVAAWDEAEDAPGDRQARRRAVERTALLVEAARAELGSAGGGAGSAS